MRRRERIERDSTKPSRWTHLCGQADQTALRAALRGSRAALALGVEAGEAAPLQGGKGEGGLKAMGHPGRGVPHALFVPYL